MDEAIYSDIRFKHIEQEKPLSNTEENPESSLDEYMADSANKIDTDTPSIEKPINQI